MSKYEIFTLYEILTAASDYIADNGDEISEPLLYFLSELTGMSVDELLEKVEEA